VVSNIDGTPRRSWTAEIEAVDDCRFFRAWLAGDVSKPVEAGHTLHFVTPSRACDLLSHASHRWAVATAFDCAP